MNLGSHRLYLMSKLLTPLSPSCIPVALCFPDLSPEVASSYVCLVALAVPMTGSVPLSFYNKIIRPTRTKSEFLIFLPLTCHVITSHFVILQNDVIDICRGVLNTPGPQLYLGLMIGIRASPGFDLTNFSIFYPILAFSL